MNENESKTAFPIHLLLLLSILLAYLVLGTLYAIFTPDWQTPDEPAHYNYIRALAETGELPVMEPGDYDQRYLERITDQSNPFPPELPIDPITYQDHQPPLYYLLAAPIYRLFDGALLPLRLFSVALGLPLLLIAFALVRALFPARPSLALMTTALIAFLPQHLAIMAGVQNDALAGLLIAAALWMAVRYAVGADGSWRFVARWGLTLGLALVAKVSTYVTLPVALLAIWLRERGANRRTMLARAAVLLLVAFLLASPWLARNVAIYGWSDPLATARHNAVVEGQPRTGEWIEQYGPVQVAARYARTTFQSFWGQFGWMGVPLRPSIYQALLLLSLLLAAGLVGWLVDRRRPRLTDVERGGLQLMAASALLTVVIYLAYNVTFVQHQGRYLFPALIPLALGAALGLEWLLAPRAARWTAAGLAGLGLLLLGWGLARGNLPLIPLAAAWGLAALFALPVLAPRRGKDAAMGALGLGLAAFALYCLFGVIVSVLAR